MTQIRFQCLINPLSLTIRLRMKRRRNSKLRAKQFGYSFPKRTREPDITIRNEHSAQAMELLNIIHIKLCKILCRDSFPTCYEVYHLCQLINKHTDTVVTLCRFWQLDNEIHAHCIPRSVRNGNWLQLTVWRVTTRLVTSTTDTIRNVSCDVFCHRRPKEEFLNCFASLGNPIVSRKLCIMERFHIALFEIITMIRDHYLRPFNHKTLQIDTQFRRLG